MSTILDWEDALPDRDLNKAEEASRWESNITALIFMLDTCSLAAKQDPVHLCIPLYTFVIAVWRKLTFTILREKWNDLGMETNPKS